MARRCQQLQFGDIKFWHWIITVKGVDEAHTTHKPTYTHTHTVCSMLCSLSHSHSLLLSRFASISAPIINSAHSSTPQRIWNLHGRCQGGRPGADCTWRGMGWDCGLLLLLLPLLSWSRFYFDLFATDTTVNLIFWLTATTTGKMGIGVVQEGSELELEMECRAWDLRGRELALFWTPWSELNARAAKGQSAVSVSDPVSPLVSPRSEFSLFGSLHSRIPHNSVIFIHFAKMWE